MDDIEPIRAAARARAALQKLPYAGALLPREAWSLMQAGAKLVDVRTQAELYWVGRVPGSVFVEWNGYPDQKLNPNVLAQLAEAAAKDAPVMFLCRSSNRSHAAAAAAAQAGWLECYNVLEGFEGDRDANKHRSSVNGWKMAQLPWVQG